MKKSAPTEEQADAAWAGIKRGINRVKQGLPPDELCVFCGDALTILGLPPPPYVSFQVGCPCGTSNGSIKGL